MKNKSKRKCSMVYEHLAVKEIEKACDRVSDDDDSSPPRHDDTSIPGTRLEPRSDKESPEVEIVQEKEEETTKESTEVEPDKETPMVDVTNIVIPVNVDDEEDEITDEVFELRRMVKGKNVEEATISPIPSPTRSPRNLSTLVSSDTKKLQELMVTHPTPSSGSSAPKLTKTNRLLSLIKAKPIIMANVPSNDPNVDAPANVPAPANLENEPRRRPEEDPEEDLEEDPEETGRGSGWIIMMMTGNGCGRNTGPTRFPWFQNLEDNLEEDEGYGKLIDGRIDTEEE
ncbi:hypothetical protein Tco_1029372 [Tanacetum coccineum]|uniref:Uncharacterized protein n=1 Tax=Tanacetum coccineum TaxID=301880 RepID=A0ABQ5G3G7_9ASTR